MGCSVKNLCVRLWKPITTSLNLRLDALEGPAVIVVAEVADIFQKHKLRLLRSELANQSDDFQEKQSPLVLQAALLAGFRERLTGKTRS